MKKGDDVILEFSVKSVNYIHWTFEEQSGFIATLILKDDPNDNEPKYSGGRFSGKLDLDKPTGSLTIKNIRTKHSGLYEAVIRKSSGYTIHQSYSVTVRGEFINSFIVILNLFRSAP